MYYYILFNFLKVAFYPSVAARETENESKSEYTHMPWRPCGGLRAACKSQFLWTLGMNSGNQARKQAPLPLKHHAGLTAIFLMIDFLTLRFKFIFL